MKAVPADQDTKIAAFVVKDQTTNKHKIHRIIYKQSNRDIGFDMLNRVCDDDIAVIVRWQGLNNDVLPKEGDVMKVLGGMMMYYTHCFGTKKAYRLFRSTSDYCAKYSTFRVFMDEFDLWWEQGVLPEKKQRIQQMLDFEERF